MRFLSILAILLLLSAPSYAQQAAGPQVMQNVLSLNAVQIDTNSKYDSAEQMLSRTIAGSKNRVLGQVHDVLFSANGVVTALQADFASAGKPRKVFVNMAGLGIRPQDSGYSMPFSDRQMSLMYPQILAGTATAAGSDGDTYSLKNLVSGGAVKGAVKAEDGRHLGTLKTVYFNNFGTKAEALYVELSRGQYVALPLASIVDVNAPGGYNASTITISDAYADAAIAYADSVRN